MYKTFMDEKAQQIFERLCNKVVNGEFDEDDIYEFYIFIRSYLKRFKGKYKWIREWGDLIAHRERVAICAARRPLVRLPAATRRSPTATFIKVFR